MHYACGCELVEMYVRHVYRLVEMFVERLVEILCMCRLARLDHVHTLHACVHSRRDSCVMYERKLVEILGVSSRIPFLVEIL